jgi:hypothetical protein
MVVVHLAVCVAAKVEPAADVCQQRRKKVYL